MATLYRLKRGKKSPRIYTGLLMEDPVLKEEFYDKIKALTRPEYKEATLLTKEELADYIDFIKAPNPWSSTGIWYLKSLGFGKDIYCADGNYKQPVLCSIDEDDIGVRPALILKSNEMGNCSIHPGDVIYDNGCYFTAVSRSILLKDDYLPNTFGGCGIFDTKTNIYEKSAVKQRIDRWFDLFQNQISMF